MTNTAGEVQLVRKGGDVMGTRSDFDILRILSHQLAQQGWDKRFVCALPKRRSMKFASRCAGYNLSDGHAAARRSRAHRRRFRPPMATRNSTFAAGAIFSAHDTLFTSGTLSRYCTMIQSLPEAAEDYVEVEARP